MAVVARFKEIILEIIVPVVIDCYIDRSRSETGRLDTIDPCIIRQVGQAVGYLDPRSASVTGNLYIAVVRPDVERRRILRRLGDGGQGRIVGNTVVQRQGGFVRHHAHDGEVATVDTGGQITQRRPGGPTISTLPQDVGSGVNGFRIVGGDEKWSVPVGWRHGVAQFRLLRTRTPGLPVAARSDAALRIARTNGSPLPRIQVEQR